MIVPTVATDELAWLTVDEMREVDRVAMEELGLGLAQMMENAGRAVATATAMLVDGQVSSSRIAVLAGSGGNGGGALVAARHLHVAGADVQVHLSAEMTSMAPVTRQQAETVRRFAIPLAVADDEFAADVVIDGLLGYGQRGAPAGAVADLIQRTADLPVVAVDTPSGLELATGMLHRSSMAAQVTVTLAMPKVGLRAREARRAVGRLLLADIGIPVDVYTRFGRAISSPFRRGPLVEVAT